MMIKLSKGLLIASADPEFGGQCEKKKKQIDQIYMQKRQPGKSRVQLSRK